MADTPDLDLAAAHKHFSAGCFNAVWDLLDKDERSDAESQQMIQLALASLWHWTQRDDCTDTTLSVGYWQASRVHAVAGLGDEARRYGHLCLDVSKSPGVGPFYLAYAYEALARAESVAGNTDRTAEYLGEARRVTETVADPESKQMLVTDLDGIESP